MRPVGLLLLAVLLVAGLAGCGGDEDDKPISVVPVGSNPVPPPTQEPRSRESEEVAIAKCLSSKGAVLYGASWCPYTREQIASFKNGFQHLNYVECTEKSALCRQNGISAYPTWIIRGTRVLGYRPPAEIGSIAGCSP